MKRVNQILSHKGMTNSEQHNAFCVTGVSTINITFRHMKRASQILSHKGMTNGEHHLACTELDSVSQIKINI